MKKMFVGSFIGLAGVLGMNTSVQATTVDLELVLAVDVSVSISDTEYALQTQGYVNAFADPLVYNTILAGDIGSIAVTYVEWSSAHQQVQLVDWTIIDSEASALAFSTAISEVTRAFRVATGVGEGIQFSAELFDDNDYESERQVIDVSGDGPDNSGTLEAADARDSALASGVDAINGIVIEYEDVYNYYLSDVIGGENSFAVFASDFTSFEEALIRKLQLEILGEEDPTLDPVLDPDLDPDPVPEPTTLVLFGAGLVGLASCGRRKK